MFFFFFITLSLISAIVNCLINMFYVFLYFSILRDPAADIIVRARERINVWTSPGHHYIPLGLRECLWIAVNDNYFYSLLPKKPIFRQIYHQSNGCSHFPLFTLADYEELLEKIITNLILNMVCRGA